MGARRVRLTLLDIAMEKAARGAQRDASGGRAKGSADRDEDHLHASGSRRVACVRDIAQAGVPVR